MAMKNLIVFKLFVFIFLSVAQASPTKFGASVESAKGEVIEGVVTEVCQKKGCFMKVKTKGSDTDRFVRFKDYGFFVPKDIVGKKIRMNAVTVSKKLSVEEQKHLLSDAKAPQEKIEKVAAPLERVEWLASGVEVIN